MFLLPKSSSSSNCLFLDKFLEKLAADLRPHLIDKSTSGTMTLTGAASDQATTQNWGAVFSEPKRAKLVEVKAKYDPNNVFQAVQSGFSFAPCVSP